MLDPNLLKNLLLRLRLRSGLRRYRLRYHLDVRLKEPDHVLPYGDRKLAPSGSLPPQSE